MPTGQYVRQPRLIPTGYAPVPLAKNAALILESGTVSILMNGGTMTIDLADFALIAPHRWSLSQGKSGPAYARAYVGTGRDDQRFVRAHRLILRPQDGMDVDHIDGDGLNNRRSNLRQLSRGENLINTGQWRHGTSGHKGVAWYTPYSKWVSKIHVAGKNKTLGYFSSLDDALSARRAAEEKYFPGANRRQSP